MEDIEFGSFHNVAISMVERNVPDPVVEEPIVFQKEQPIVEPAVEDEQIVDEQPIVEPAVEEEQPIVEPAVEDEQPTVEPAVEEEQPIIEPAVKEQPVVEPPNDTKEGHTVSFCSCSYFFAKRHK